MHMEIELAKKALQCIEVFALRHADCSLSNKELWHEVYTLAHGALAGALGCCKNPHKDWVEYINRVYDNLESAGEFTKF